MEELNESMKTSTGEFGGPPTREGYIYTLFYGRALAQLAYLFTHTVILGYQCCNQAIQM